MTAIDSPVGEPHVAVAVARSSQLRLVQSLVCLGAGAAIWLIGHLAAVWAAKRDPAFVDVVRRHLRYPQHLVA